MKSSNDLKDIFKLIQQSGTISRRELADRCNISKPTAKTLVSSLEQQGFIKIIDGISTGGRIPQLVKIKRDLFYSLGIDIGNEYLRMGIVDLEGNLLSSVRMQTNIDKQRSIEIPALKLSFEKLCREAELAPETVQSIGIGITGIVNEATGECLSLRNTPSWKFFNVKDALSDVFQIENIAVFDSVRAMTIAEQRYGKGRDINDFIYLSIGIGLGAGIVVNGRMISGTRGTTGEIGHMHIRPSEDLCVCGNYGCLESIASGWAILRKLKKAIKDGVETSVGEGKPLDEISVGDIVESAKAGDKIAVNLLENMVHDLSLGIGSIINLLNPEKIILGGGLVRCSDNIIFDSIIRGTKSAVIPWLQKNIDIEISQIGEWDGVIGAAAIGADLVIENYEIS